MGLIARAAGAALLLGLSFAASAASVWFSSNDSLYRLDPSSNQAVLVAAPGTMQALAVSPKDGSAWVLVASRLLNYNESGVPQVDLDLKTLGLQNPSSLTLDPYDATLWLFDGKTILRLGPAGQALNTWQAPGVVRTLTLGVDENIWVLGDKQIWRFDSQGTILASQDLTGSLKEEPKFLAVDSLGDAVWVAGEKQLVQLKLSAPGQINFVLPSSQIVSALALDQKRGLLWVLARDSLIGIAEDGSIFRAISLGALGLSGAAALVFDSGNDSLWLAHSSGLARFTSSGDLAATIATGNAVTALGVAPFALVPSVPILQPLPKAFTNNARPEFQLAYDALCSGASCGFAPSFFASYSLSALLNNQPVGSLFTFDINTGQASFTPASRLPEGSNTFRAQVQDRFGHQSDPVANTFTVDTIPPRFLTITPSEGSTFATPNVVIQGTTDDPTATVVLSGPGLGAAQTGNSFSFPAVLKPGLNTFVLSAIDPAGNVSAVTLHLSLANLSVSIASPVNGATINGGSVTVSGTFQGPSNTGITVNGVVAALSSSTFIAPNVPLQPGANTLTVTASASGQQAVTRTISVTSSGPAPIEVAVGSAEGVTPLATTFSLNNRTGNTIQSIRADFTGSGFFSFFDPLRAISFNYRTPGTFNARFIITDSAGITYNQTLTIVVQSFATVDNALRATYNGMLARLKAGDIPGALDALTASVHDKYLAVFNALAPNLSAIVDQLGTLQPSFIGDGLAEYVVVRTDPISGAQRGFRIYLLRGDDGVWRIDNM